jgi:hypothetical protein
MNVRRMDDEVDDEGWILKKCKHCRHAMDRVDRLCG